MNSSSEYCYHDADPTWANSYLWPIVRREVGRAVQSGCEARAFDLGCGNGATAGMLADMGLQVTGIDPSQSGVAFAHKAFPNCRFAVASAYDDLAGQFGRFPLVVSLEVVEHLYDPKAFARVTYDLLEPGGTAIISTPYHGYFKNLLLALTGKLESHFTVLWDGGHIKFFSIPTLEKLLRDVGFSDISFVRVGRLPIVAKSMIAIARRN